MCRKTSLLQATSQPVLFFVSIIFQNSIGELKHRGTLNIEVIMGTKLIFLVLTVIMFEFVLLQTFELKEEKEKLEAELIALKRKLTETQTIEIQLKKQLQKQANRIQKNEDESSLIIEENKLLKAQVSALLEGGMNLLLSHFVMWI